MSNLTPEQIEEIARKAAETALENSDELIAEAVSKILTQLGVDAVNPIEMQRDFQHLREWRQALEDLKRKGIVAAVGVFATGVLSLVLLGLKEWFGAGK